MTITELTLTAVTPAVTTDIYRDIHKAIRVEMFSVTAEAGRLDPSQGIARAAVARHVDDVVNLLIGHAEHEDGAIQPELERHLPDLAQRVAGDHVTLEARMDDLREMAADAAALSAPDPGRSIHRLYVALASFTSDYLKHQDVEERVIMPALEAAIGPEACAAVEAAIVSSISPDEMARLLSLMLPAMNIDNRVELLGGMRQGAPAEVFEGVWTLAGTVLDAGDLRSLADRLGIS